MPYPLNLWSAILERPVSEAELPADWKETIELVLINQALNRNTRYNVKDVILAHYRDGRPVNQIAKDERVSAAGISLTRDDIVYVLQRSCKDFLITGWAATKQEALPIPAFAFPPRVVKALIWAEISTIGALCKCTEKELRKRCRNLGEKGIEQVKSVLAEHELALRESTN